VISDGACCLISDINDMKADIERFREERTCKVCLEDEVNRVFLPCGHMSCCDVCADQLYDCPMCRKRILAFVKVQQNPMSKGK
jgi:hypothetical protein